MKVVCLRRYFEGGVFKVVSLVSFMWFLQFSLFSIEMDVSVESGCTLINNVEVFYCIFDRVRCSCLIC